MTQEISYLRYSCYYGNKSHSSIGPISIHFQTILLPEMVAVPGAHNDVTFGYKFVNMNRREQAMVFSDGRCLESDW